MGIAKTKKGGNQFMRKLIVFLSFQIVLAIGLVENGLACNYLDEDCVESLHPTRQYPDSTETSEYTLPYGSSYPSEDFRLSLGMTETERLIDKCVSNYFFDSASAYLWTSCDILVGSRYRRVIVRRCYTSGSGCYYY